MTDPRSKTYDSLKATLIDSIGVDAFSKVRTVLEFGSGAVGFVHWYGEGKIAYAVDLLDYTEAWASRGIRYIRSDGASIDLPDNSIDLVVSHSVVEHVADLPRSLREIDRVLKQNGIAYFTVAPLYYSGNGSHIRTIPKWEHLRPGSEYYLMDMPIRRLGAYLNKLTLPEFLSMIGSLPWDIVRCNRRFDFDRLPSFLEAAEWPEIDLRTREFRLVARKVGTLPII